MPWPRTCSGRNHTGAFYNAPERTFSNRGRDDKRKPKPLDVKLGWPIAKKLGEMDIGQAIAVKEKEILAVEAIEGTAKMIERAGKLCSKGAWTLIKVAKPNQDMRFDVPCIGTDTIKGCWQNMGENVLLSRQVKR